MTNELRPFWRQFFFFNWKFGLLLIFIICIPRFILVLNANETANYSLLGLVMMICVIVPFVFLNKYGRKVIGLSKPKSYFWLVFAFIIGLIFSVLLYYLGELMYGSSFENWYVYIGKSYNIPSGISANDKRMTFVIMAITGMLFSPIGEELFLGG